MSFDAARAIFSQVDSNQDGGIDRNEFNQWANNAAAGLGGASNYQSASYSSYGTGAGLAGAGLAGSSVYESAAYGNGAYGAGAYGAGAGLAGAAYDGSSSVYESSSYGVSGGAGLAGAGYGVAGGAGYNAAAFSQQVVGPTYPTDAQGLFVDSNPAVIRRPAAQGVQTYTQNIRVKFLQPPPVPPHGPLIIKEVRPPQPPAPAPLRIRQQAPPLPTPPPLVLRERPPQPPAVIAGQTVIRRLAALPVPPRSVIIERLPPLPPKPRDIIIERWTPYAPQAKRRTILQRAGPAVQYAAPKNVIIQYEPVPVRIVRQFQRLGVAAASPAAYVQQYGGTLLDAGSLVQQARAAGVVEDITAPAVAAAYGYNAAAYGQDLALAGGWGGYGAYDASAAYGVDAGYGAGSSVYESASYAGNAGLVGNAGYGLAAGLGGGYGSSSFYETSSSYGLGGAGVDVAGAAFRNADINQDGAIDRAEFANFFQQGL